MHERVRPRTSRAKSGTQARAHRQGRQEHGAGVARFWHGCPAPAQGCSSPGASPPLVKMAIVFPFGTALVSQVGVTPCMCGTPVRMHAGPPRSKSTSLFRLSAHPRRSQKERKVAAAPKASSVNHRGGAASGTACYGKQGALGRCHGAGQADAALKAAPVPAPSSDARPRILELRPQVGECVGLLVVMRLRS